MKLVPIQNRSVILFIGFLLFLSTVVDNWVIDHDAVFLLNILFIVS
jgi:hypothetical protein